jgi:two-component sensor histidine kinase
VVLEAAESAYRLTVADDGPGLPPTYGQSKGLGRNLIQAFARQAGGRLDRVEGPGARFVLTLPR